ncbi:hypothetical protein ACFFSW_00650 [Saccharothrix longispora]|uniref:Uncharacterized protein n=1 Tax=Saccharothrix longispora TaxID=33920 RepID=A0ABU1PV51_9PSEU|nr:hypothetical protein [Saccharothrix longispora]MDR6594491.1 hypothetical protein [Saccharothrix longispora]
MAMLVGAVFSGLSALSVEDVEDAGDVIVVRASTRGNEVDNLRHRHARSSTSEREWTPR